MARPSAITRIVAIAAVTLAISAPAAYADPPYGTSTTQATAVASLARNAEPMSPDNWAVRPAPDGMRVTPATAITQTGGGFDWVDAAIGTMATLGVLLASAGARAYIRRRHALAA